MKSSSILLMTDNVALVQATLNSIPYPITAGFIGKKTGLDKTAVNKVLYAGNNVQFEQLECLPPLWRNKPVGSALIAITPVVVADDS
jgi:hypothetical protein